MARIVEGSQGAEGDGGAGVGEESIRVYVKERGRCRWALSPFATLECRELEVICFFKCPFTPRFGDPRVANLLFSWQEK